MNRYKSVVEYIETLTIQQGRNVGRPFRLLPWQRKFLRGFCSTSGDAALSLARGGGKSTFAAALLCCYFDGPLMQPNSEIILVASAHGQAGVVFNHAVNFLGRDRLSDKSRYRFQSTNIDHYTKDLKTGVSIRSAGADSRKLHGAAPVLSIYDELAQWPPSRVRSMLAALTTSAGKIPGSRAVWIGTRPESSDHPFQQALDGKNRSVTYRQTHAARDNDPPFRRTTWKRANPGLDAMPDLLEAIEREAAAAKDNSELLPQFEALRLNKGIADHSDTLAGLITPEVYADIESGGVVEVGGDYVLALDVGGGFAQTAAAAVSLDSPYIVEALASWPGIPELKQRARGDNLARYTRMIERGELIIQIGRRTVDLSDFIEMCFDRWGRPVSIVCDRYRQGLLLDVLSWYGYTDDAITWRGMGHMDGSEDVRRFQRIVTDRNAVFKQSLLLKTSFAVARLIADMSGNQKIAKHNERGGPGKDDAAVAAVLGLAEAERLNESGGAIRQVAHFTPVDELDAMAGWEWQ